MKCRLSELKDKEVVHIGKGIRIGYVDDVEINIDDCRITAIVVYGRCKCWGILGREDDVVITWDKIEVIGEDTILVNCNYSGKKCSSRLSGIIGNLFK